MLTLYRTPNCPRCTEATRIGQRRQVGPPSSSPFPRSSYPQSHFPRLHTNLPAVSQPASANAQYVSPLPPLTAGRLRMIVPEKDTIVFESYPNRNRIEYRVQARTALVPESGTSVPEKGTGGTNARLRVLRLPAACRVGPLRGREGNRPIEDLTCRSRHDMLNMVM